MRQGDVSRDALLIEGQPDFSDRINTGRHTCVQFLFIVIEDVHTHALSIDQL